MPTFTHEDWFSKHIPMWETVLHDNLSKDKPLHALEIGSFEGRSTVWLLDNVLTHPDSNIICIDSFDGGTDLPATGAFDWKEIRNHFEKNTESYKEKVELWVRDSKNLLPLMDHAQFDLIYVDGSHQSAECLIDSVLSHLLLKEGGIIIFDDYLWFGLRKGTVSPKPAIDAFMECFAEKYAIITIGYQVILQKIKK